ncbi:MAG: UDP-N-acetylmuramate dehydrogenase [Myxococcota bacterium]
MFEGVEIYQEEPLAPYTTLHLGGPAEFLALPKNKNELILLLKHADSHGLPVHLLGGGSNLLISDAGVRGMVIHLAGDFNKVEVSESGDEVRVGSAFSFPKLTRLCLELGWEGALGWNGTPGLVGGALKMNAGTRLGELGAVVSSVEAATAEGSMLLTHEQMGFSYRNTNFPAKAVLCSAHLVYRHAEPAKKAELLAKASDLAKRRKESQPKQRSAGSMFKNPPGDYAGRLIEACGLKGARVGGAKISEVHANFFVNDSHASSKDMLELSQMAQKKVYDELGIKLEYEVRRWGFLEK